MTANRWHIEPLTEILRLGGEHKQPCYFSCMLRYINPTRCEVLGVSEKKDHSDPEWMKRIISEIREALTEKGLELRFIRGTEKTEARKS